MKMTLKTGVAVQIALQISETARVNNLGQTRCHREMKSDGKHKARATRHDGKWKRIIAAILVSFMHRNAPDLSPERPMCTPVSFLSRVKMELKSDNCCNKNKLKCWLYVFLAYCIYQWLLVPLICQNPPDSKEEGRFMCKLFSAFLSQKTQIV